MNKGGRMIECLHCGRKMESVGYCCPECGNTEEFKCENCGTEAIVTVLKEKEAA